MLYRHSIQAACLLALAALLPIQDLGELVVCLLLAGFVTWRVFGFVPQTAAASRPDAEKQPAAPAADTFLKRIRLAETDMKVQSFPGFLSLGDDYEQPEPGSCTPGWKYEPETLNCRLVPTATGCDIYVSSWLIGSLPEPMQALALTWLEQERILKARASFYGGPYRKCQGETVVERESPWSVQLQLTVRRKNS